MKIINWNIERPAKRPSRIPKVLEQIRVRNADIIVLTETISDLALGSEYHVIHSAQPTGEYQNNEVRVSIFSKFPVHELLPTYDSTVSVCVVLETPAGLLAVYGTIMGILGNRNAEFKDAVSSQLKDFERISKIYPLCVVGDFNISFSDNFYFTKKERDLLVGGFDKLHLVNVTQEVEENIDHIVLSKTILESADKPELWNQELLLSDHIGLSIDLQLISKKPSS